ncbi:MAG: hypothetical protein WCL00_05875 [Bacteroidota bacterium]
MSKIVQYLAVKEDRSLFRIKCNERFAENEQVEMTAEVYNESYEMINQPDVNLDITDEHNHTFNFVFGRNENAYTLNAGNFPVGKYNYEASVKNGKNLFKKTGSFVIAPMNLEAFNLVADHNLLYRMAAGHGGKMFYPAQMDSIYEIISQREEIKPVIYTRKQFSDLVGTWWVFLIILGLLTAEWLIRKRSGIY